VSRLTLKLVVACLLVALLTFATRFFPVVSIALDSSRWIGELGLIGLALLSLALAIGSMDSLIAAHALALGATLVSNNPEHFFRVKGLTTVDRA